MGCGKSKIDSPQVDRLPKLPPVLSRRLQEIRRFRSGGTLSKKELLKDGYQEDCGSAHQTDGRKSVSSEVPVKSSTATGSSKVAPQPTQAMEATISSDQEVTKAHDESTQHGNNDNDNKDNGISEEMAKQGDGAVTKAIGKLALEETDDEQEIEDQYRRLSSVEGSRICPGSPSFRVYYVESMQDKEGDDCKDDYMNKCSLSDTNVASQKSSEESAAKTNKRGRKVVKFRRVILKGKPVKNLLSVKSCYYPSCGGRLEISRTVYAKSATT